MPNTDGKVTDFGVATSVDSTDVFYLVRAGTDKQVTAATFLANVSSLFKTTKQVVLGGTPQALSDAGTINVTTTTTTLVNTTTSALAINDGLYDGQIKILLITSATGTSTLSGVNVGVTSVVFNTAGQTAMLFWVGGKWWPLSGTATINL